MERSYGERVRIHKYLIIKEIRSWCWDYEIRRYIYINIITILVGIKFRCRTTLLFLVEIVGTDDNDWKIRILLRVISLKLMWRGICLFASCQLAFAVQLTSPNNILVLPWFIEFFARLLLALQIDVRAPWLDPGIDFRRSNQFRTLASIETWKSFREQRVYTFSYDDCDVFIEKCNSHEFGQFMISLAD